MELRISKQSDVPVRQQLAEQITYLIATGKLKSGETLPSVRELARRLKVHHNTVSEAYQDLVRRTWLVRHRGSRLVVAPREIVKREATALDLDDLINVTIQAARRLGYSLQALRARVRERLLAQPPDHILVVEQDSGLREIIVTELRQALDWPVAGCSRTDLAQNPGLAIGAMVAAGQYAITAVEALVPRDRPPIGLSFCAADEHVKRVQELQEPSVIAIVSVSEAFLKTARGLMAPSIGTCHTLQELLLPLRDPNDLRAADLVFVDSVALRQVGNPKSIHYRLIDTASLHYVASATTTPPNAKG